MYQSEPRVSLVAASNTVVPMFARPTVYNNAATTPMHGWLLVTESSLFTPLQIPSLLHDIPYMHDTQRKHALASSEYGMHPEVAVNSKYLRTMAWSYALARSIITRQAVMVFAWPCTAERPLREVLWMRRWAHAGPTNR